MNVVLKRLLVFFVGIPAVIGVVYFLPFCRNLIFSLFVTLFSGLGAVEFSSMLKNKNISISNTESFILGALAPLSLALTISFNFPGWIVPLFIMSGAAWGLFSSAFATADKMDAVASRLSGIFCVLVYPGFFMYWLVKLASMENAPFIILLFLFITFGTDSAAWLFGNLFGKNNRGVIPASPNKSVAGYVGGAAVAVVIACAILAFPSVFTSRLDFIPIVPAAIILGFFTGAATAFGDMAESAIKRSCAVKDSGTLMQGRGGVLDSIDSVALGAPVFFVLFNLLFTV